MKGVILTGGKGTRLWPLTEVTNKHLVPVGNLPMIEYPLYTLNNLGVDSISVVTGGEHFKDMVGYLGNVHRDINFSYHYQIKARGNAQAVSLTEKFLNGKIAVMLGNNIFEDDFSNAAREFEDSDLGLMLFLKEVNDPSRFGVAEIDKKSKRIISIEAKPKIPKSNLAITGLYFYDESVFNKIKMLQPSLRGELELTDLNKLYLKNSKVGYSILKGFWDDAGVIKSRQECEKFVKYGLEDKVISTLQKNNKKLFPIGLKCF